METVIHLAIRCHNTGTIALFSIIILRPPPIHAEHTYKWKINWGRDSMILETSVQKAVYDHQAKEVHGKDNYRIQENTDS